MNHTCVLLFLQVREGKQGTGSQHLSDELKEAIAQKWQDVVGAQTTFQTYNDFRKATLAELIASNPSLYKM